MGTQAFICSCNGTVALDADRIGEALDAAGRGGLKLERADELCRRECGRALAALDGTDDVLIGCTQEAPLFSELAQARRSVAPIRFFNTREQAGRGEEGARSQPKIAALVAAAASAVAEPVPAVTYRSQGRLLIIGAAADALPWAARLKPKLSVSVLLTDAGAGMPPGAAGLRDLPVSSGEVESLSGWLGAFDIRWKQANPIDLDACVRCGACVAACPEGAITAQFQVDASRCTGHRACVDACGTVGAIDFARPDTAREAQADLVLDLRDVPAFARHQPPQGYFHPGRDEAARMDAAMKLADMVGEFEKPKFFRYDARICAHGRNGIEACRSCIDVCSTQAIRSDGDKVFVEPHLCMGCGACATVCPSGAMTYQYPTPRVIGQRVRDALAAYAAAGGRDAVVLFHDGDAGRARIEALGAPGGRGLPARVIPFEVHHAASVGLDLMLAAIAFGASQVAVLLTGEEAPQYADALRGEATIARALLEGAGLSGEHVVVLDAPDAATLGARTRLMQPARAVPRPARFAVSEEKRRTVDMAIEHIATEIVRAGGRAPMVTPLPQGAAFGTIVVDPARCTLCMACAGACPESALADGGESPALRFVERNCVQCGLCANTCPEDAITLQPRWLFGEEARRHRVVAETQPFHCVRCAKPFGTRRMIETMLSRLSGHAMFGGAATRRLQMCADCRVVDMVSAEDESTIHDVSRTRR